MDKIQKPSASDQGGMLTNWPRRSSNLCSQNTHKPLLLSGGCRVLESSGWRVILLIDYTSSSGQPLLARCPQGAEGHLKKITFQPPLFGHSTVRSATDHRPMWCRTFLIRTRNILKLCCVINQSKVRLPSWLGDCNSLSVWRVGYWERGRPLNVDEKGISSQSSHMCSSLRSNIIEQDIALFDTQHQRICT
jgi:hypothetical protein